MIEVLYCLVLFLTFFSGLQRQIDSIDELIGEQMTDPNSFIYPDKYNSYINYSKYNSKVLIIIKLVEILCNCVNTVN